jgi:hypothetical protein
MCECVVCLHDKAFNNYIFAADTGSYDKLDKN